MGIISANVHPPCTLRKKKCCRSKNDRTHARVSRSELLTFVSPDIQVVSAGGGPTITAACLLSPGYRLAVKGSSVRGKKKKVRSRPTPPPLPAVEFNTR